jgi:hypothetical protein
MMAGGLLGAQELAPRSARLVDAKFDTDPHQGDAVADPPPLASDLYETS